jgi:hypothetical protein
MIRRLTSTVVSAIEKGIRAMLRDFWCLGRAPNPNVFYELGIAHPLAEPVFICVQSKKDIPFRVAGIFYFTYSTMPCDLKE